MLDERIKQIMEDEEVQNFLKNIKEKIDVGEYIQQEVHKYMLDKGYYRDTAKRLYEVLKEFRCEFGDKEAIELTKVYFRKLEIKL